ncbi:MULTISPECIES: hypothetical protein [Thermosipho]|uniref:Uncharacterized protein n=1 Tax=Thermosipho affectus TaxID=660294 RepID=A0ABX3IJ64_9BACT|nr:MULTISPECIES: hypothetical protein [Thermosipho]ANQ53166.1 hypothetical protein Y592_01280 [Thermosipho sp. 1070]APT71616.1 hypothetical protein BG95_01275 [Thermosipho sp. 1063]MBT1248640.1 hypothetical protein [Thermosipho sp. 1244]ONN27870.1 hypothetical protein XJ44_01265 [Thermosipho affectus]OOC45689.1 hypothetical protein XO08_01280 [Thermosipho sp. 1074]
MENNMLLWIGVGVLAAALVVGAIFFLLPKDRYIEAQGIRIWKLPKEAENVQVSYSYEAKVAQLAREGRLFLFEGVNVGGGVNMSIAENAARTQALGKIAEFLNAKVETFRKVVEGQLQSVQTNNNEEKASQQLVEAAVSAYKGITKVMANAIVSGALKYASWEVRKGNIVELHVLYFYDPTNLLSILESQALVSQTVGKLGKQGVDFFKALNSVLDEASKGTPLEGE